MALAIDASSPAVATQATVGTTTVTTASFTPPAGSVLVIGWNGNNNGGATPTTPTITDSLGAHLTYTQADWVSHVDSASLDAQAAFWTAPVGSSAAMTVTVTNHGVTAVEAALKIWVLTGENATPVGAHGKGFAVVATGSIAQGYTAQATSGWGFLSVCDWNATGNETAGTGCTVDGTGSVGAGQISYAFARRTTADDANGVTNTLRTTLAANSTNLSWVYIEILPVAAAATFPPQLQGRRRFVPPRYAKPLPRTAKPVPPQLIPPFTVAGVKHALRLRALLPRRGRAAQPVPPQLLPPYPAAGVKHPGRLRSLLPRRGRSAQVVPAQAVVAVTFVPQAVRARVRQYIARRRPAQFMPADQPSIVAPVRAHLRPPRPARGHATQPVPAQTAPVPPAYVPQGLRARIRSFRLFRSRTVQPVPPQVAVPAPTLVPGRARQATVRLAATRRGHTAMPPVAQAVPPLFSRVKLRAVRVFRGKARPVVPPQVIVIPPAYPPSPARSRKKPWPFRRRAAAPPPQVPTAHSCTTTRPNTGITARPGSGTTAYNTAATSRPDTGTTARPDTGITQDPC